MEDITYKTRINHHLHRESEEVFNNKFQSPIRNYYFLNISCICVPFLYSSLRERSPSDAGTSVEKNIVINEHRTGTR